MIAALHALPPKKQQQAIAFLMLIAFVVVGLLSIPSYRYQINPDGIAHITIAKLYLMGDFRLAINGMRSPLLSWLLVPFLACGIEPLLAVKLLQLGLSLIGFWLFCRYIYGLTLDNWLFATTLLVLIPILLWMAYGVASPDFLLALLLWAYLRMLWRSDRMPGVRHAVLAGVLGGFAYWAKHYAFPFVMVHYTAHHLWKWLEGRRDPQLRRQAIKKYVSGMLFFGLVSGAWMLAMQQKYGLFKVSYTSDYNFALMAPDHPGHPVEWKGLIAPPHPYAVSIWDDPFSLIIAPWRPWNSLSSTVQYLKIIRQSFSRTLEIWLHFSPFSYAIVLAAFWFAFSLLGYHPRLTPFSRQMLLPTVIFASGYLMIGLEERYIWFVHLLLFCMALGLAAEYGLTFKKDRVAWAVLFIVLLSFGYFPLQNLFHHRNTGKTFYEQAQIIRGKTEFGHARVASNKY